MISFRFFGGGQMQSSKKLRVIVIEDDPTISGLFKKVLQGYGCDVRTFPDPTAACAVFCSPECDCRMEQPCTDALITDMVMPNMNGLDLLRLQRKRGCKALNANKALMSAITTPQQQAAVAELGCHFFRKPFNLSEVKQWIKECAERIH
jgi:CheY-like chemotaxis protein